MNDDKLIKTTGLTSDEICLLREKFLNNYSKEKGWNPNELSTIQMLEIVDQTGYRTPGLILS